MGTRCTGRPRALATLALFGCAWYVGYARGATRCAPARPAVDSSALPVQMNTLENRDVPAGAVAGGAYFSPRIAAAVGALAGAHLVRRLRAQPEVARALHDRYALGC